MLENAKIGRVFDNYVKLGTNTLSTFLADGILLV